MAREPFLINPPRRIRRRSRRNPGISYFGEGGYAQRHGLGKEEAEVYGPAAPKRTQVSRKKAKKKGGEKMTKSELSAKRSRAMKRAWKKRKAAGHSTLGKSTTKRKYKKHAKKATRIKHRFTAKRVSVSKRKKGKGLSVVWANPRRKVSRRKHRRNPGGSLLIAGANPRRRRHYRRNPALTIGGFDFLKNAPLILTGALSAASLVIVPNFLKLSSTSPLVKYGVQAGVVVGGGYVTGKTLGSQYAYSWMLAGSAVVLADILQNYVFGALLPGSINLTQAGFGAFPSHYGLSAFPNSNPMPAQKYDTLDVYPSAGDDGPY